jgi:MSHA biogenesis protein MshG
MNEITFNYTAVSAQGVRSQGQVSATTVADALRKLSMQGLTPLDVTEAKEPLSLLNFQNGKITSDTIAQLTRELAVLLEARIPLAQGLASIADTEPNPALQKMLNDVASSIEAGAPLTQALEHYQQHFGPVYMETLRAAERSGDLVGVMRLLADLLDKIQETRQLLRRAMTYPIIVMGAITLAISVIVIFVIPKFAATFASQGVQMPMMTRVLQAVGDSVRENWIAYGVSLVTVIGGAFLWGRTSRGRACFEHVILHIPYIDRIILAVTASRFVRVMGIGLSSGLDIIDSIEISGRATGRPLFAAECQVMAERLRRGEKVEAVIRSSRYLPNFAKRILGAGKDSQEMSRACNIVAHHYEREASHLSKNINTIIEPVMTFALAAIVLVVALSVFLPMWQMARIRH